ncbi:hypothetical protein A2U01_0042921, partial [Trifolium medium]|nr:hypothetical protein [Trifolium medium]
MHLHNSAENAVSAPVQSGARQAGTPAE